MSGCSSSAAPSSPSPVAGVRDVICVASGKGGVGKSTLTVNLAAALAERGLAVGVLDADIQGPSVALLLGTGEGLDAALDGKAVPCFSHGIHSVSIANVLAPEAGLTWKGPLVAQAVEQLFHDVAWPGLDILLVDLPPGTGDVQITILERIAVSGAVVISTPQRLSAVDAERGISLFHEYDVPVFGLVENMDGCVCPCCGEVTRLYAGGRVEPLARKRHIAYFGGIPLDPAAHEAAEAGTPLVIAAPGSAAAQAIRTLAARVVEALERERVAAGSARIRQEEIA